MSSAPPPSLSLSIEIPAPAPTSAAAAQPKSEPAPHLPHPLSLHHHSDAARSECVCCTPALERHCFGAGCVLATICAPLAFGFFLFGVWYVMLVLCVCGLILAAAID
jgi:hypothetical protein